MNEKSKINFGKAIRIIRILKNLKAKDLAEKLNITHNYLSNIENNKSSPSLALLTKIADEFKISLSQIVLEAERLGDDNENK